MKTLLLVFALSIMTTFGDEDGRRPRVVELPIMTQVEEATLELEGWMINDDFWDVDTFVMDVELEDPLCIEDWMISGDFWE